MTRCSAETALTLFAVLALLPAGDLRAADSGVFFVGAEKCRFCHSGENKGAAYRKWLEGGHSKAFQTLASDKAKKIAKERSVADPQKDKACVSCHVTAYNVPADKKDEKFDPAQGVQCESCHGPGGRHSKRRLEELTLDDLSVIQIPPGEIAAVPSAATCQRCHNENSPTRKPLNYAEELKKISHLDPRKKYPADYLDKVGAQGGHIPAEHLPTEGK